jgi:hypothetical protein
MAGDPHRPRLSNGGSDQRAVELTERQRVFVAALIETETVGEAAARAGICRRTAYYELDRLQEMTGARTVRMLIYLAGREGWLKPDER